MWDAAAGGLIMSASHNPGGPDEDWGIKFNYSSGEPAPERITDAIYGFTKNIAELKFADIPDIDLSQIGRHRFGDFEVLPFLKTKSSLLQCPQLIALVGCKILPIWCAGGGC
jgi:phosphoglucomutase